MGIVFGRINAMSNFGKKAMYQEQKEWSQMISDVYNNISSFSTESANIAQTLVWQLKREATGLKQNLYKSIRTVDVSEQENALKMRSMQVNKGVSEDILDKQIMAPSGKVTLGSVTDILRFRYAGAYGHGGHNIALMMRDAAIATGVVGAVGGGIAAINSISDN